MASNFQIGMQGVFLTAAELTRRGLIVSLTARNAFGADLLVTDQRCNRAWSVQVKTNQSPKKYWLLRKHARELTSDCFVYVFVSLKEDNQQPDYIVASSRRVAKNVEKYRDKHNTWYSFWKEKEPECEGWSLFPSPSLTEK